MKKRYLSLLLLLSLGASFAHAQLKTLAISDVKAASGLVKAVKKNDTVTQLERVVQAFDSQLTDKMHATRKFSILARSDLKQLQTDNDAAGASFRIPGADYVLVTTIDDFQDYSESIVLPSTGERLSKRIISATVVAKIYDSKSGRLLESANVTRSLPIAAAQFKSEKNGELSDALLLQIVGQVADATANRVADVIFPAKIVSKINDQVTINRGDGTAIAAGQVWEVYALGQEIKDPDTGEILDRERMLVGKVRIVRVNPKTSLAAILEDRGVDNGAIVQPTAPAARQN
jgi:curli biogenesis system outer membrane secretion channel CsgG